MSNAGTADLRQAIHYLEVDAPPITPDKSGKVAVELICERLYAFGVPEKAATKLLQKFAPDCDAKMLASKVQKEFELQFDEPGLDRDDNFVERPTAFRRGGDGKPIANDPDNIRVALEKVGVRLSYDLFAGKAIIEGLPGYGPVLQDDAVRELRFLIHDKFQFVVNKDLIFEVVQNVAQRNSFHPVREYFDRVQSIWDGVPRLDRLLIDYAGAADTAYVRAVGALPLIAAVRRIRQPGAKFDEMLVLESAQGKNKSSALAILAVRQDWFTDSITLGAEGKTRLEELRGKLIAECPELVGKRKGDIDKIKAMLSATVDRGRPAYGRIPEERARQCVLIGSVNEKNYLNDPTGNRRFWPVKIRQFNLERLRCDLDQLWAEAATREAKGESIRLDRSLWAAAAVEQQARTDTATDPITEALADRLRDMTGKISGEDVWRLVGKDKAAMRTQDDNRRVGGAMKHLGWKRQDIRIDGEKVYGYVKGKDKTRQRIVVAKNGEDIFARYEHDIEDVSDEG